jgi:hypothetical protein
VSHKTGGDIFRWSHEQKKCSWLSKVLLGSTVDRFWTLQRYVKKKFCRSLPALMEKEILFCSLAQTFKRDVGKTFHKFSSPEKLLCKSQREPFYFIQIFILRILAKWAING